MGAINSSNDSKGIAFLVVDIVFTVLATIAVSLRVWARRLKRSTLALNDYAVIAALVFTIGLVACQIAAVVDGGTGQHLQDAGLDALVVLLKLYVPSEILWALANTGVKISILHLYITIFRHKTFRRVAYGVGTLTLCYCLVVILEAFLLCQPLAFNWDKTIPGFCADQHAAYISAGIINLIIDVSIIILPMPMLWGLQMAVMRKVALTAIFSLGALICIITILRIVAIQNLDLLDFTYSSTDVGIWTALEPTLGIANACLPVLQPVISKLSGLPVRVLSRAKGSSKGDVDKQKLWSNESYKIPSRNGRSGQKRMLRPHGQPYGTTDSAIAQFVPHDKNDSDIDLEQHGSNGLYPGVIKVTNGYTVRSNERV